MYLKHFVWRRLNTRWHVGWFEGNLLYLLEVVLWIAVENHLTHWYQRILTVGPDLKCLDKERERERERERIFHINV